MVREHVDVRDLENVRGHSWCGLQGGEMMDPERLGHVCDATQHNTTHAFAYVFIMPQ